MIHFPPVLGGLPARGFSGLSPAFSENNGNSFSLIPSQRGGIFGKAWRENPNYCSFVYTFLSTCHLPAYFYHRITRITRIFVFRRRKTFVKSEKFFFLRIILQNMVLYFGLKITSLVQPLNLAVDKGCWKLIGLSNGNLSRIAKFTKRKLPFNLKLKIVNRQSYSYLTSKIKNLFPNSPVSGSRNEYFFLIQLY